MRRRRSKAPIIILVIIVIALIFVGQLVTSSLPESLDRYSSLIFWGIVAGGGAISAFICGRFFSKR